MLFLCVIMLATDIGVSAKAACDANAPLPHPDRRLDWHQVSTELMLQLMSQKSNVTMKLI